MSIVIVGAGALGSNLVQFLRNIPDALHVVDHDRVEQKNVAGQFHGKPNVGKMKTVSLTQGMQFFFNRSVIGYPTKLTADNAKELLTKDRKLIVDCLDNAASRKLVQVHARGWEVPCIHGALAGNGQFARVVWDEVFDIDEDDPSQTATCDGAEHLPFIAITAAYLAYAIQAFLKDNKRHGYQIGPTGAMRV
jgi:molybdopterin/thiamine biosynthesis adenylyltransferase